MRWLGSQGGGVDQEKRLILRFLEQSEWDDALTGKLPHFDGFHWQPGYCARADADRLTAAGKLGWRYLNVLQAPCPEWAGGDPILDRMAALIPTLPSTFPWFPCTGGIRRPVYDWRAPAQAAIQELVTMMARERMPFFLDQFWPHPRPWMCAEGNFDSYDPGTWVHWTRKLNRFAQLVRQRPRLGSTVVNGDFLGPKPVMLEHPEWWGRFEAAVEVWHEHPLNVLAPDAGVPWAMQALLDLHIRYPEKWIALKGAPAAVVAGYRALAWERSYEVWQ